MTHPSKGGDDPYGHGLMFSIRCW